MAEPTQSVSTLVNTIQHRDMQEVLRKTLPTGVSQERFTQAVVAALRKHPEVFVECDRASVYGAVVECARDGLVPDGRQAALVPFNTKGGGPKRCQYMIMPEGIIDKLAKIGVTIYATSVYAGEKIRIWNDDEGQHVEHEPSSFGSRGDRIGAYACAKVHKTGVVYVEAMNMDEIDKVRKVSRSRDKNGQLVGAWIEWPDRMEQKSCLHRLCKRLPNVEIPDDEEFDEARSPITIEVPPVKESTGNGKRPAALQRVVETAAEEPPYTDAEVPHE